MANVIRTLVLSTLLIMGIGKNVLADTTLNPGENLNPGEQLEAVEGRYLLAMQHDGNLVLYRNAEPVFATGTEGHSVKYLAMQTDGNLVLYDINDAALWASGTDGYPRAHLILQDDGNAVIYQDSKALWATNTVDQNFISSLPKTTHRKERVGSGFWIEADIKISSGGAITGNITFESKNALLGFTGGWLMMLSDKDQNVLYMSDLETKGVNAAIFGPTESVKKIIVDKSFSDDIDDEEKIAYVDILMDRFPQSAWDLIKKNIADAADVAKNAGEFLKVFDVIKIFKGA